MNSSSNEFNKMAYQAPLARQESINDITLNLDDLYFDDSINFNAKPIDQTNNRQNLDKANLKIQINTDYADSDAENNSDRKNRTSTPRNLTFDLNRPDLTRQSSTSSQNKTNNDLVQSNSLIYSFTSSSGNLRHVQGAESSNFESSGSFSFNQTKSDTKLELNNPHNITNTTNYTSIEKLEIIKPQSKDYILCFDTSSLIDQNSSIETSNEALNFKNLVSDNKIATNRSLTNVMINARTSLDQIKSNLSESSVKKFEKPSTFTKANRDLVSQCYDSGVDTARTLSPQIFSTNLKNEVVE